MKEYKLSKDQQFYIERMRLPFVVCQFLEKGVVTLAISDGFCELFGYKDRAQAYSDMNLNMFKDIHPDDTAKFANAILRFGTEGGRLEVVYRTKKKDGSGYKVIHLNGEHVYTDDGLRLAQIWLTDEGDYKEESGADLLGGTNIVLSKERPDYAARYDYLTGLPNMAGFLARFFRRNTAVMSVLTALRPLPMRMNWKNS